MPSTYRATVLTGRGGLDKIVVSDLPLDEPGSKAIRVKVLATGAGATDLIMRTGSYIFAPNYPFTLGYEVVGTVDKIGEAANRPDLKIGDRVCALITYGGMAEYCIKPASRFVKVEPGSLSDDVVVALLLNYMTAYQMLTRTAPLRAGQTALVTGANGGIGSALLELCRELGVKAYGYARKDHFDFVRARGAEPIEDKRSAETVDAAVLAVVPGGVDCVFDVLGGSKAAECLRATRRGGTLVGYGFSAAFAHGKASTWLSAKGFFTYYVGARFAGRRGSFYGVTAEYNKDPRRYEEDLPRLFDLVARGSIAPVIAHRLPLLAGRRSQELMEQGGLQGKIVLTRELGLE